MGFSSPARRDPPPQTHYYCIRGAATPLSRWWPRRQEMLALRVLPHRASCWGPQRAAAESLTLRSKSAKSPAYLPPGSLRWSLISFRTQVLTPSNLSGSVYVPLAWSKANTVWKLEPIAQINRKKISLWTPVSPGKQQYIPKHCPALCYVYTVILKHMMLHLQIYINYICTAETLETRRNDRIVRGGVWVRGRNNTMFIWSTESFQKKIYDQQRKN